MLAEQGKVLKSAEQSSSDGEKLDTAVAKSIF